MKETTTLCYVFFDTFEHLWLMGNISEYMRIGSVWFGLMIIIIIHSIRMFEQMSYGQIGLNAKKNI